MTPDSSRRKLGLRTPELDERRAREAEDQWQEHLDKCAYEEWEAEQLDLDGGLSLKRDHAPEIRHPASLRTVAGLGEG